MLEAQYYKHDEPNTLLTSGGLGTMGFAVPAAIGAKAGKPDRMVWAIDGDGCFQMTNQELVTARLENFPVKIAVLNNGYLGMVRQWQEFFYEKRYAMSYMDALPDFVKLAESYGCVGIRAKTPDELDEKIKEMIEVQKPVISVSNTHLTLPTSDLV